MKSARLILNIFIGTLIWTLPQSVIARTHLILLDSSSGMKQRYVDNLRCWLVEPLLTSTAFAADDRIILRWFDQRGNSNFDPNDRQRKYDGKFDAAAVSA